MTKTMSDRRCRMKQLSEDNEQHRERTRDVVCLGNGYMTLRRTQPEPDQDECLLLTSSENQPGIGRTDGVEGNACHFHLLLLME